MLDKPKTDMQLAPGWRFPRFLRFGNNGDTTAQPKARKPPQEPEERKHQFAVWYVFAAFLGLMLIQYVWGYVATTAARRRLRVGAGR